jgi:hypothetical protein
MDNGRIENAPQTVIAVLRPRRLARNRVIDTKIDTKADYSTIAFHY